MTSRQGKGGSSSPQESSFSDCFLHGQSYGDYCYDLEMKERQLLESRNHPVQQSEAENLVEFFALVNLVNYRIDDVFVENLQKILNLRQDLRNNWNHWSRILAEGTLPNEIKDKINECLDKIQNEFQIHILGLEFCQKLSKFMIGKSSAEDLTKFWEGITQPSFEDIMMEFYKLRVIKANHDWDELPVLEERPRFHRVRFSLQSLRRPVQHRNVLSTKRHEETFLLLKRSSNVDEIIPAKIFSETSEEEKSETSGEKEEEGEYISPQESEPESDIKIRISLESDSCETDFEPPLPHTPFHPGYQSPDSESESDLDEFKGSSEDKDKVGDATPEYEPKMLEEDEVTPVEIPLTAEKNDTPIRRNGCFRALWNMIRGRRGTEAPEPADKPKNLGKKNRRMWRLRISRVTPED